MATILGIDPSLNSTGVAVLDSDTGEILSLGKIVPPSKEECGKLHDIYTSLMQFMAYQHIDVIVCEDQFMQSNAKTLKILSHVRGIIMMIAGMQKIPFVLHAPSVIKQAITGKGNATKDVVYTCLSFVYHKDALFQEYFPNGIILTGKSKNDDISDALAIARTHLLLAQPTA